MTITADGFFDWMDRDPGPADKVYSDRCLSEIVVFHDAVGYYAGWMSRLKSAARDSDGRYTAYAAASVTGWLPYRAGVRPIQHYSIFGSCWASGSRYLNIHGNAFENESAPIYTLPGGAWAFVGRTTPGDWHNPPPQSDWQVECAARVETDLAVFFGRSADYWCRPTGAADVSATEYEHNETVRWGGLYSSCPNGRIRWANIAALRQGTPPQEEDDMLDPIFQAGARMAQVGSGGKLPIGDQRHADELIRKGALIVGVPADLYDGIPNAATAADIAALSKKIDALKVGAVDVPALAKALGADATFVKAIAKAVNDDAAARLKE